MSLSITKCIEKETDLNQAYLRAIVFHDFKYNLTQPYLDRLVLSLGGKAPKNTICFHWFQKFLLVQSRGKFKDWYNTNYLAW